MECWELSYDLEVGKIIKPALQHRKGFKTCYIDMEKTEDEKDGEDHVCIACGGNEQDVQNQQEKATDKKEQQIYSVWHYYNGAQQDRFNRLVASLIKQKEKKKGIVVGDKPGNHRRLERNVLDAIHGKAGAEEIPNIFAAYGDGL